MFENKDDGRACDGEADSPTLSLVAAINFRRPRVVTVWEAVPARARAGSVAQIRQERR